MKAIINEYESGIATAKPSIILFDKVLMCCLKTENKVNHEEYIMKLHSIMLKYLNPIKFRSKTYGLIIEALKQQQRSFPSDSLRQRIFEFQKKKILSERVERADKPHGVSSYNSRRK